MRVGHGERGRDPAKGIDDMHWYAVDYALDGVANELGRRDDHTACQQNCCGE